MPKVKMSELKALKKIEPYLTKLRGETVELEADLDQIQTNADKIAPIAQALSKAGKLTPGNLVQLLGLAKEPGRLAQLAEMLPLLKEKVKGVDIDKFLSTSPKGLGQVKTILEKIPEGKPVDEKAFDHILGGFNDHSTEDSVGALGNCIQAMQNANIPMKRFWKEHNVARIVRIAKLDEGQLVGVSAVLKGLTTPPRKALDERTFNFIVENPQRFEGEVVLAENGGSFKTPKADAVVSAFTAMENANIPIVGNRQAVMNMEGKDLVKLSRVLPQFDFLKPKQRLSSTQFNWLCKNVGKLELDQIPHFGECVKAMNGKVPLVSATGHNRFNELMGKGADLKGIATILKSLGNRLDDKTFDYVLKNSPTLAPKADKIAGVFEAMKDAKMELEGLRQPVMEIKEPGVLEALTAVLGELKRNEGEPPLLDKSACKNLIDKMVKDKAEKKDWTPERARDLGGCFKAMQASNISLTPFLRAENPSRLMSLNPDELAAVNTLLTRLAKDKNLDKKTFDYIVDNAESLAMGIGEGADRKTRAGQVVAVFDEMKNLGIPITGNRQPIMKLAMPKSAVGESGLSRDLSVLHSVLTESNKPPKIAAFAADSGAFKDLRDNIHNLAAGQVNDFMACLRAMNQQKIPLTSSVPLKDGNLAKLLKLGDPQGQGTKLKALATIVNSLGKSLNEKTFEYLVKNANDLTTTKATEIANVFGLMTAAGIDLKGNRQPVMKMGEGDLKKLGVILAAADPGKVRAEGEQKLLLNNDTFKMLRKGLKDFDENAVNDLAKCIAAMNGNVPVQHQVMGNRIEDLMKVGKNPDHLAGVAKILQSLAGKEGEKSALDDSTFDYVVKNAPDLAGEKAEKIAQAFNAMRTAKIEIAGHRQPLMELAKEKNGIEKLQKLTDFLTKLKAPPEKIKEPLGKEEFKALRKHVDNLDKDKVEDFAGCINAMRTNRIPLTETLPFKEDRLAKLLARTPGELNTVNRSMTELAKGSNLNKATFDYIVDHADKLNAPVDPENPEGEKKVDRVLKVFKAMDELKIPIKGNRQPVMNMSNEELRILADVLGEFKGRKVEMSKDDFKALRKNVSKLQGWKPEDITQFGQCVAAMNANKIPLTPGILNDRLGRLMALATKKETKEVEMKEMGEDSKYQDPEVNKLETVNNIFQALGKELDGDVFDYVVDNVANGKLTQKTKVDGEPKTKAQRVVDVFSAMKEAGITELKGHRRAVMDLTDKQLVRVKDVLTNTPEDKLSLTGDAFKVIRKNADKIQDKEHAQTLRRCIQAMNDSGIPLTQMIGSDRLANLMQLGKADLQKVETLMATLNKHGALDKRTLVYLVDHASKFPPSKVEKIDKLFELMGNNKIGIKGNRQPLMNLGEKQLDNLISKVSDIQKLGGRVTDTDFKQFLKESAKTVIPDIPLDKGTNLKMV